MNYFNFENIGKKVAIIESTDKKINDPTQDRSLYYIYGPCGSGQSTLAKGMIQIYLSHRYSDVVDEMNSDAEQMAHGTQTQKDYIKN